MSTYFDSSAIVKVLVAEEGSSVAVSLWSGGGEVVTSRLSYPEVRAALARARRNRRLTDEGLAHSRRALVAMFARVGLIELTGEIASRAGDIAERFEIRAGDAVHLASAISASPETVVATWDRRLARAARAAGLDTVGA